MNRGDPSDGRAAVPAVVQLLVGVGISMTLTAAVVAVATGGSVAWAGALSATGVVILVLASVAQGGWRLYRRATGQRRADATEN